MSGEFTASARNPITSEPIINIPSPQSRSQTSTQAEAAPRKSEESLDPEAHSNLSQPTKRSSMRSALEHAKRKLSLNNDKGTQLAGSEEEFQQVQSKEVEKQKRKEDYERLGLGDKVKFGQGGMQMSG